MLLKSLLLVYKKKIRLKIMCIIINLILDVNVDFGITVTVCGVL